MQSQPNNIDYTHVIVLDDRTWTVFGTGLTEEEALEDAAQWSDTLESLTCYAATEAAYEHAKALGADASGNLASTQRPNRVRLAA